MKNKIINQTDWLDLERKIKQARGKTDQMNALILGNQDFLKKLIKENKMDAFEQTQLVQLAISARATDAVKAWVACGVDPNLNEQRLFFYAVEVYDKDLLQMLLSAKGQANKADSFGNFPIQRAASSGQWDLVEILINQMDPYPKGVIHYCMGMAASNRRWDMVDLLIQDLNDVYYNNNYLPKMALNQNDLWAINMLKAKGFAFKSDPLLFINHVLGQWHDGLWVIDQIRQEIGENNLKSHLDQIHWHQQLLGANNQAALKFIIKNMLSRQYDKKTIKQSLWDKINDEYNPMTAECFQVLFCALASRITLAQLAKVPLHGLDKQQVMPILEHAYQLGALKGIEAYQFKPFKSKQVLAQYLIEYQQHLAGQKVLEKIIENNAVQLKSKNQFNL